MSTTNLSRPLVLLGLAACALGLAACVLGLAACAPATPSTSPAASAATSATAAESSEPPLDEASPAQHVLNAVYESVVSIHVSATSEGQTLTGSGSGVVYTEDGYILTNAHVLTVNWAVTSGQEIIVHLSSGETVAATLVGMDTERDIAAIKIEKTGLPPVTFAEPGDVQLGEWAIVIGSPFDLHNTVTLGIVSGLDRTLERGSDQAPLDGLIQIDAPISPGSSGGGLFDTSAHLVGMPEVYLPPESTGAESVGFAIPASVVAEVALALTGR